MMDEKNKNQQNQASADDYVDCYLHNVTEVQKAQSSNRKYFNCIVQSSEKSMRAVCYSPEKRNELKALATAKSPVKMSNFKKQLDDDLIITKYTNVTPLNEVAFPYSEEIATSTSGKPILLSSIHSLVGEQLISVKGEAASMSGVKAVSTQFSGRTNKQEVMIRDHTASVKVVLWGKYVNTLQPKKTYMFKNLRLKVTKYERYLNTPRNELFSATECESFSVPLVQLEEDVNTTSTITGSILGVQNASKSFACIGCNKRSVHIDGKKAVCQSCNLVQFAANCKSFWYAKVLVKPSGSTKNIRLILANEVLEKFLTVISSDLLLNMASEEELVLSILDQCLKEFDITYDNIGNGITDISLKTV